MIIRIITFSCVASKPCHGDGPSPPPPPPHRSSRSRKSSSNPYAGRGLDKFAIISRELEAKRKLLVSQLGIPLPFVWFARFDEQHSTSWIPIIASPSLSRAQMRALRRAASELISTDGASKCFSISNEIISGNLIDNEDSHGSSSIADAQYSKSIGAYNHGAITWDCASQGILWLAKGVAFSLMIVLDMATCAILSRWHAGHVAAKFSPKEENGPEVDNNRSVLAMVTSTSPSSGRSLPSPCTPLSTPGWGTIKGVDAPSSHHPWMVMAEAPSPSAVHEIPARGGVRKMNPPSLQHSTLHARGAPTAHNRRRLGGHEAMSGFPSTPNTPREYGIRKLARPSLLTTVSLPKAHRYRELNNSSSCLITMANRKSTMSQIQTRAEKLKLGQVLTWAGLVLGLGGLQMGYLTAIIAVVCWWYMLPTLRKAVGDKLFVRSHHHAAASAIPKHTTNTRVFKMQQENLPHGAPN